MRGTCATYLPAQAASELLKCLLSGEVECTVLDQLAVPILFIQIQSFKFIRVYLRSSLCSTYRIRYLPTRTVDWVIVLRGCSAFRAN